MVIDDEETQKEMDEIFGEDARSAKREKAASINEGGEYDGLVDEDGEDDIIELEVSAEEKPADEVSPEGKTNNEDN